MTDTSTSQFADQLRDLWRTRPVRDRSDGKIAGVAAGIGRRYNVDPLLVRIAFVVSAIFGGAGIALYLACWLALPDERGHMLAASWLGKDQLKLAPLRLVALIALLVLALPAAPFGKDVGGAGLLSAAVLAGGLWLLYQRTPVPPATATSVPPEPAAAEVAPVADEDSAEDSLPTPKPPAWDPLQTAQFAWDLPEPAPVPEPDAAVPGSRLTAVVLGLALLVAAGATAVAIIGGVTWLTPDRIAAAALAVIGLGLVIGAFRRTGHGLLIVAAPLAGFVILSSLVGPIDTTGGVGGRSYTPPVAELQTSYRVGVGELRLDLREVRLDRDRTVDASAGIGRVEVLVPAGTNVRIACKTSIGDTNCLPDQHAGDGPLLTINARTNIGEVVVSDG